MGCDPEVCVPLADGSTFRLSAYVRSREAITEEFSRRMPGMQQFVADWLRAHEPDKWHKRALTAKSYLLQEAEGISRRAKLAWAARRGDVRVANLQHDGIVVALPTTVQAEGVAAGMTAACSEVLGYEQPVCEKPLAVAAPAAEEGLRGSDAAEMVPEPEVAMVSVPPHGEAVSHASHESSEFEFGGAQPPSPADGQAEDEDAPPPAPISGGNE